MSASSTTACSRSPSPATPEATDNLDPVITQEVVNAWCHSLSQDAFFITNEAFENDKEHVAPLDLGDLIQDDAYDECVFSHWYSATLSLHPHRSTPSSESLSSGCVKQSSPSPFAAYTPPAGFQRPTLNIAKSAPITPQLRRDLPTAAMQSVVYPPKDACTKYVYFYSAGIHTLTVL